MLNNSVSILSDSKKSFEEKLSFLCNVLQKKISHYDWVGFYFSKFENKTLELKAFAGSPTEHKVIPFGKGVCGEVAISNKTSVVQNVNLYKNYISCNMNVKSEIVVPIFDKGVNIGHIDVDSYIINAFKKEDVLFLEKISKAITKEINILQNDR